MSNVFVILSALLVSVSSFAGPSSWTYFDGASRVVAASTGWIQLEAKDKAYCNGRVRLVREYYQGFDWRFDVQGSWCDTIKVGYTKSGEKFVESNVTTKFDLDFIPVRTNEIWSGYGVAIRVAEFALYQLNNSVSRNQISFVLYTDKRDDTKAQAYEKLTLEF